MAKNNKGKIQQNQNQNQQNQLNEEFAEELNANVANNNPAKQVNKNNNK
ncbi:hypothetical protein [Paenibacillus daejeonensis]|nr:hypothetical protein [Paenibacillus daejeonensis]